MMKYGLNVEELFPEMEIYDKIEAAKKAGFDCVEFWGWNDRDMLRIKKACEKNNVTITAFKGELNWSLCDDSSWFYFKEWLLKSIEAAKFLGAGSIIFHSNHIGPDGSADFSDKFSPERLIANITSNLMKAAPILEENGITMQLEPISNLGGLKGNFLTNPEIAADIIRAVGSTNVKLLFDAFQMQIMRGNLTNFLLENLDLINYIHIADSPKRSEPGTGEINYSYILNELKSNGFEGVACLELTPTGSTEKVIELYRTLIDSVE